MPASQFLRIRRITARGAVLLGALALVGCGGDSSQGPSLAAQHQAAKQETDPGIRARKLVSVALELSKAGDMSSCNTALAEAQQSITEVKEPAGKAAGLNLVADASARAGNTADAKKQLRAARNAADEVEDVSARIPLLARTAEILALRLEDATGAVDILKESEKLSEKLEDPPAKVAAQLRVVAGFQVAKATGDVERLGAVAVEGARGLSDERKKAEALADAGGVMQRAGLAEQAAALFAESDTTARKIEDASGRGYALLNLANRLLAAGAKDKAGETIQAAEAAAEKVSDRALREELVKKINDAKNKL